MGVLDKKQPSFVQFREKFLETVAKVTGQNNIDPYTSWQEIGNTQVRENILHKIKADLELEFGFELVLPDYLLEFDGVVESVTNQVHHNFSTMYIVERINAKKAARQQYLQ